MANWVCPSCSQTLPASVIKPSGAFLCPTCQSDLRVAQPVRGIISLSSALLPFLLLYLTNTGSVPWVILAFISAPYISGIFILLTRSVVALPLSVHSGPLDHFTMTGSK